MYVLAMNTANPRKAALRNSPTWLDALDLGDEPAPVLVRPSEPNAAEVWAASLPTSSELVIRARRVELTERAAPVVMPIAGPGAPMYREPSGWHWTLASIVLIVVIVWLCASITGVLH